MIIAEVGQNHCGDMVLAHKLIHLAQLNGADLVKFQLYDHNLLYKDHPEIPNVELTKDQAFDLFSYGKKVGIEVFFSVFDIERVKWCGEMGVKRYKVGARIKDPVLFSVITTTGKPVLISYDFYYDKWGYPDYWQQLYCVSKYPTEFQDLQFESGIFEDVGDLMGSSDGRREYHKEFDGFSDHTIGLDAAKIALARGAGVIEKHFCIAHNVGIDAKWSMTPKELRELKRWETVCKEIL